MNTFKSYKSMIGDITVDDVDNKQGDNYGDDDCPNYATITTLHCTVSLNFNDDIIGDHFNYTLCYITFEHRNGEIQDFKISSDIFYSPLEHVRFIMLIDEYLKSIK